MSLGSTFKTLFILAPIALTACSKSSVSMKGVDISTSQIDSHNYVNFQASVTIGSLQFPSMEVPILNPSTLQSFGQLALDRQADGTNKIYVSLDMDQVSHLDSSLGYSLPNNREIPLVLGATNASLIGIPVLQNSRIYVGGDLKKDFFIGAAITISAFDSVMNQVSLPLNIFTTFPFSSGITGVGGLFTSPTKGQNGIAIFAKRSATTNSISSSMSLARTTAIRGASSTTSSTASQTATLANSATPTEVGELDNYTLYRLNNLMGKRAVLRVK